MFGRRRDIPPYEIMRPGGREARKQPASAWRAPRRAEDAPAEGGPTTLGDWLTGGEPVVLRLPKGVALLIAAGVLLLILVAYWVGHARGGAAADARYQERAEALNQTRPSGPMPVILEPDSRIVNPPNTAVPAGSVYDTRVKGLNYLILAQYPEAEAQRLHAFLAERGVETLVTSSDNARLFLVVGAEGYQSPSAGKTYQDTLRRLGREWKSDGRGGDDLSTMWWKKYE